MHPCTSAVPIGKRPSRATPHPRLFALVGGVTAVVLVLTANEQLFDTNFYSLWEATALLAGDHPYRDFYEWGVPLQAGVSEVVQLVAGNRLIGEFLLQWLGIVVGVLVSFHLGLRATRSITALLATMALTVPLLAATPTYHYPKLLFYPTGIWLAWRYMERPGIGRSAVFGVVTAAAFLFRHDHGLYLGGLAVLAFAIWRVAMPSFRVLRPALADAATFGATAAAVLAPWLVLVHVNEGLPEYVRSRAELYREWSARRDPYADLLTMNPLRTLTGGKQQPAPAPATVSVEWNRDVDDGLRSRLEREHGLRVIDERQTGDARRYQVPDVHERDLVKLLPYVRDTDGFNWDELRELTSPLPTGSQALLWLEQISLLVPLLLLVMAGTACLRSWRAGTSPGLETYRIVVAATFLALIDARLFREPSYFVLVAPVTAALSARLFPRSGRHERAATRVPAGRITVLRAAASWALAAGLYIVTALCVFVFTRGTGVFEPSRTVDNLGGVFTQLMASPPIDAYQPLDQALRYDVAAWNAGQGDTERLVARYLHHCTRDGDRIFVTGSTPFHIGYYAERPIAGGHLFWHHQWRSDGEREGQSLALLERQSVPFAMSTSDPVLDDLKAYPRIRDYFVKHYVALDGAGLLLVDTRRQPSGRFGTLGFPCFR